LRIAVDDAGDEVGEVAIAPAADHLAGLESSCPRRSRCSNLSCQFRVSTDQAGPPNEPWSARILNGQGAEGDFPSSIPCRTMRRGWC
jgi:hypothetical protein